MWLHTLWKVDPFLSITQRLMWLIHMQFSIFISLISWWYVIISLLKDKQTSLSLPSSASSSTMWGSSIVGPDDSVGSSVPDSVGNVSVVIVTVVGNGTLTRTDWFCV